MGDLSTLLEGFIVTSGIAAIFRLAVLTRRDRSPSRLDLLSCALYGVVGAVLHSALIEAPRIAAFLADPFVVWCLTTAQAFERLIGKLLPEGSDSQRNFDLQVEAVRQDSPPDSDGRTEQIHDTAREAIARPSSPSEKPTPCEQLLLGRDGRDLDSSVGELREESSMDSEARTQQAHKAGREAIAEPSTADEKPTAYEQLPLALNGDESQNQT